MAWTVVKLSNLPLGKRILRYGDNGQDVGEVQRLLSQAGFYFGEQDGHFGLLTVEAVTLFQKTFQLRVDGIAGWEVINLLKNISAKNGRIIYTVKKHENLRNISQRFGVSPAAWKRIPGQGNPNKKIYPGLKMLLDEKAFFCWDFTDKKSSQIPVTGLLRADYQIERNGELNLLTTEKADKKIYQVFGASREVWREVLSCPKTWPTLVAEIKKTATVKFGFDLREAPRDKIIQWLDFLKFIERNLKLSKLKFLVLPFLPVAKKLENQLYWMYLTRIGALAEFIMIEPIYNLETPLLFEASAVKALGDLRHLVKLGLASKTFLISWAEGWDWNLDQNSHQKLPYRVARIIQAQYFHLSQYSPGSKFNCCYYRKTNKENHCLIWRDETGWADLLAKVTKLNLFGIVIGNFKDIGQPGPKMIASAFKVLPAENI